MQTEQKILEAAYHCFMNFGYSATSIVMIGKYADVSRFTVHNYFKNKEEVFRAVVKDYGECAKKQCMEISEVNNPVWQQIQQATEIWFAPIFKEPIDQIVFSELSDVIDKYADDIRDDHNRFLFDLFNEKLAKADLAGEIKLSNLGKSAEDVAKFLATSIHCIKSDIDVNYMAEYIEQLVSVYRVATQPQQSY